MACGVAILGIVILYFLLGAGLRLFLPANAPAWVSTVTVRLLPLVPVALIGILLWESERIIQFLLERYGVVASATVIASRKCGDDGNVCMCGEYVFHDQQKREYRIVFKRDCYHEPTPEQWGKVTRRYSVNAQLPIRYVGWLPRLHEVMLADD